MGEEAAIHIMERVCQVLPLLRFWPKPARKSMSMMSEPILEPDLTVISKP